MEASVVIVQRLGGGNLFPVAAKTIKIITTKIKHADIFRIVDTSRNKSKLKLFFRIGSGPARTD